MIRVQLPGHLRQLAQCDREVSVDAAPTLRAVLDALEAAHPPLRGTMRDATTKQRRAFVRFFACEHDLSNDDPGAALPEAVADGTEPLRVVGAMAGG